MYPIYKLIYLNKNLNEFYNLYEDFNVENYKLDDIKFVYHLNMELYDKSIDIYNYLLRIIINIKSFINNIKKVNEEIDDKIKKHQKMSSSLSSSNDFRKSILLSLNIKEDSNNSEKEDLIEKILFLLSRVNETDLIKIKTNLMDKKIYMKGNYENFIKIQSLRTLKRILKVLEVNKKDDVLEKLNRFRNFINDFSNINICDYEINYHNTIKEEFIYSDLENKNFISYIRFYSNSSNDKLILRLFELKNELLKINYYNSERIEIIYLLTILGLYEKIVSVKLTD